MTNNHSGSGGVDTEQANERQQMHRHAIADRSEAVVDTDTFNNSIANAESITQDTLHDSENSSDLLVPGHTR